MKFLINLYKTTSGILVLILIGHWLFQVVWAWERFWQGILVFCLLCLSSLPWNRLEAYFSNDIKIKGKFYKDNSNFYKFSWFLCLISGYFAIGILMLIYWFDSTDEGPHGFGYWSFTGCIYFLFLFPTFRGRKELEPQVNGWMEKKAKERQKQKEADLKANKEKKEAELKAKKERDAKIESDRLALEAEKQKKLEEEEAKKRAEEEKLQKELDTEKTQVKEILKSLKTEPIDKINKLSKKKEDLEILIDKEKNIINELSKKYSFLKKIVPDRFD